MLRMSKEAPRSLTLKKILAPATLLVALGIPSLTCGVTAWANDMKLSMISPPRFTKNSDGFYSTGRYEFSTRLGSNRIKIEAGVSDFVIFGVQTQSLTDPNVASLFGAELNLGNYCGSADYISSEDGIIALTPGGFCLTK